MLVLFEFILENETAYLKEMAYGLEEAYRI